MGMFSTKKKHYVDTQVVRVIEDALVPSALTTAMLNANLRDIDIVEAVKEQISTGSATNFKKMYRYAEKGKYFYGLPDAKVISSNDGLAAAEAALVAEVGGPITLDYMYFRPLNNTHAAWKLIYEAGAYSPVTNQLPALSEAKGYPVYLEKIVAIHGYVAGQLPEKTAIGVWGGSASAGATTYTPEWSTGELQNLSIAQENKFVLGANEAAEIHYVWVDEDGEVFKEFYTYDLSAYDTDQEYYHARYTRNGVRSYWIYDPKTGGNAALNNVFSNDAFISPGTYFPFAVFRAEGANRATDALMETEEYKTTEKMLSYIGMDFRELADSMHDDSDIANVDQAVLMMAVPIDSQNEVENEYLFKYFEDLHGRLPAAAIKLVDYNAPPNLDSQFGLSDGVRPTYAVDISDADFRMTLSFDAIEKKLRAGSIGDIGTRTNTSEAVESLATTFDGIEDAPVDIGSARVLRHQVTLGVYEEIRVVNPKLRYHIYRELGAEGGAIEGGLLIPLDYNVCKSISSLNTGELYFRSLHLVFNSHVVQKIKWYQTGWFAALLTIVAVVVTILTLGTTWKAVVAAATIGAKVLVILKAIFVLVILPMAVGYAATEIAKVIGPEATAWLAIAAIAIGGYKGYKAGGFAESASARNLLTAANGLQTGAMNAIDILISDLMSEKEAFDAYATAQQEELDAAKDLLGLADPNLDLLMFGGAQPLILFGESPEFFYNRMAHTGNPGAESLNLIQNFVKNSITLPTIEETLGDMTR